MRGTITSGGQSLPPPRLGRPRFSLHSEIWDAQLDDLESCGPGGSISASRSTRGGTGVRAGEYVPLIIANSAPGKTQRVNAQGVVEREEKS